MWTLVLTSTMVVGMWQVPRNWHGWIWYLGNECLWLVYGLATRSHPIIVMSLIAGAVGIRNLKVARELASTQDLQGVRPSVQLSARSGRAARFHLRRVHGTSQDRSVR